jgi:hypothetical protein
MRARFFNVSAMEITLEAYHKVAGKAKFIVPILSYDK